MQKFDFFNVRNIVIFQFKKAELTHLHISHMPYTISNNSLIMFSKMSELIICMEHEVFFNTND